VRSLKDFSCAVFAVLFISNVAAIAEDKSPQSSAGYVSSLGDMMGVIQLRHAKLWYAASLKNWPLADYELARLNGNLKEATRFYPNMPSSVATGTDDAVALVGEAIRAKDGVKFGRSFAQMTAACNSCHEAAGRAFILVRTPTRFSPYSNQVYTPR
jgi:hypothetical protein